MIITWVWHLGETGGAWLVLLVLPWQGYLGTCYSTDQERAGSECSQEAYRASIWERRQSLLSAAFQACCKSATGKVRLVKGFDRAAAHCFPSGVATMSHSECGIFSSLSCKHFFSPMFPLGLSLALGYALRHTHILEKWRAPSRLWGDNQRH